MTKRPITKQPDNFRARMAEVLINSNPLAGLGIRAAQALYDSARASHGSAPLLQRVFAEIEAVDPVLLTCVERRAAALSGMGWQIETTEGADDVAAARQRRAAEQFFSAIENLDEAIEHLGSSFFRGYAFADPVWNGSGTEVARIDLMQSYNVLYSDGDWYWNPGCAGSADGLEMLDDRVIRVIHARALDYPAMFIYLRHALSESDWGRYIERYGIPPTDVIMSPDSTEASRPEYEAAAEAARDGISVVWPSGSTVTRADASRGTDPFSAIIEHQEMLLVLMATGGTLTSLAQADTGSLAGGAQMDVWKEIVRRSANVIAGALHRALLLPFLRAAFPMEEPLVRFALGKAAKPTPSELLQMAATAKTAGYVISQTDLESGTGLKFVPDTQNSPDFGGSSSFGAKGFTQNACKPVADPLQNARNDLDGETAAKSVGGPQSADFGILAEAAIQRDLEGTLSRIAELTDLPEAEQRARAAEILRELDDAPEARSLSRVLELAMADAVAGDEPVKNAGSSQPAKGEKSQGYGRKYEVYAVVFEGEEEYEEYAGMLSNANGAGACRAKDPSRCTVHGAGVSVPAQTSAPNPAAPASAASAQQTVSAQQPGALQQPVRWADDPVGHAQIDALYKTLAANPVKITPKEFNDAVDYGVMLDDPSGNMVEFSSAYKVHANGWDKQGGRPAWQILQRKEILLFAMHVVCNTIPVPNKHPKARPGGVAYQGSYGGRNYLVLANFVGPNKYEAFDCIPNRRRS